MSPSRKTKNTNALRINAKVGCMAANISNGALRILQHSGMMVTIGAKPVFENEGFDAE